MSSSTAPSAVPRQRAADQAGAESEADGQAAAGEQEAERKRWRAGSHVRRKLSWLQEAYCDQRHREHSPATATLARLRRGVGKEPGDLPELWEITFDGLPNPAGEPDRDPERTVDSPLLRLERAVYTALTLYAVHQQSKSARMHQAGGNGLGAAVRLLAWRTNENAVRRRFEALGTADSLAEAVNHARGLITQLRGEEIPLDYGRLADDLQRLQDRRYAPAVRRRWGRDYFQLRTPGADADQDSDGSD